MAPFFLLRYKSSQFLDFDPEDGTSYVEEIFVDIIMSESEDTAETFRTTEVNIGYIELHYYNRALAINNGINIFEAFDRSINTVEIGETILDSRTGELRMGITNQMGESFNENILVIHDFGIFPEMRRRGIGEIVMKGLVRQFQGKCGLIVLKSFPKQHEGVHVHGQSKELKDSMHLHLLEPDSTAAQKKLNAFYKKCGFTELRKFKNFFAYSLDRL